MGERSNKRANASVSLIPEFSSLVRPFFHDYRMNEDLRGDARAARPIPDATPVQLSNAVPLWSNTIY
jgi:hypothetical protein